MAGYCMKTCFNCQATTTGVTPTSSTCSDVPPPAAAGATQYTCAEQKGFGKCAESWMVGYCAQSCFNCATGAPNIPANVPTTGSTSISVPIDESMRLTIVGSRFQTAAGTRVFLNGVNQAWQNYGRSTMRSVQRHVQKASRSLPGFAHPCLCGLILC